MDNPGDYYTTKDNIATLLRVAIKIVEKLDKTGFGYAAMLADLKRKLDAAEYTGD